MDGAKLVASLLAPHFKLGIKQCPTIDKGKQEIERIPHAIAVGSFMYAMVCVRPYIAHAIGTVNCFLFINPGKEHWNSMKNGL